jgi:GDP-L-fucose synthase
MISYRKDDWMIDGVRHLGILGAGGLLGSEIARQASAEGLKISAVRSHEVDATNEGAVRDWLETTKPDAMIVCAARNAGVHANIATPADMLADNARIAIASIAAARQLRIPRLLYCSSSAIYPPTAPMPYREIDAGSGPVEESHLGYASAKLLGTRFCQSVRKQDGFDYTALLLTNIYGPGQSYDPSRSNVVAGLMARIEAARLHGEASVEVWGTGDATRDLIYAGDAASIALALAQQPGPADGLINVASGREISIREVAANVAKVVGFTGSLVFDSSKPEGAKRRSIDVTRLMALGLQARTTLNQGIRQAFAAWTAKQPL